MTPALSVNQIKAHIKAAMMKHHKMDARIVNAAAKAIHDDLSQQPAQRPPGALPDTALLYNYTGLGLEHLAKLKWLVNTPGGLHWRELYATYGGSRHIFDRQGYAREDGDLRIATDSAKRVVAQYGWMVP